MESATQSPKKKDLQISRGGKLIIGQEFDSFDGGFETFQSFSGDIVGFVFTTSLLTDEVMIDFQKCVDNTKFEEEILSFKNDFSDFRFYGDLTKMKYSEVKICNQRDFDFIIPEKVTFDDAIKSCNTYNSTLIKIKDAEHNIQVSDEFIVYQDNCRSKWETIFWLGVKIDLESHRLSYIDDESPVEFNNIPPTWIHTNSSFECVSVGSKFFRYEWYPTSCDTKVCSICSSHLPPIIKVFGTCRKTKIDRILILRRYKNSKPVYDGYKRTTVFWNNSFWIMNSKTEPNFKGIMLSDSNTPLGLHTWKIYHDNCNIKDVGKEKYVNQISKSNVHN